MVNKAECYDAALQQVRDHRHLAIEQSVKLREELLSKHPVLQQIENELISLSKQQLMARINQDPSLSRLMEEYDALHLRRSFELQKLGYSDKVFSPAFQCSVCEDNGMTEAGFCDCVKQIVCQKMLDQLCRDLPDNSYSFDTFSLGYYEGEDRCKMEQIYIDCQTYADKFSGSSDSLYMLGNTGLGKTHLTFSIAKEVVKQGVFVVYCSAPTLVTELEKEHFGHTTERISNLYQKAELLIIDDLGTEFTSQIAQSVLYQIINQRCLAKLPTIINSNLTPAELEQRYGERLVSRIFGCYRIMRFVGKDIRIQKRLASKKV